MSTTWSVTTCKWVGKTTESATGTRFLHCIAMKHRVTVFLVLLMTSLLCVAACRETPEQKDTTWLGTPPPDGSTATDTAAADTASATHPASPGGTALVPEVAA